MRSGRSLAVPGWKGIHRTPMRTEDVPRPSWRFLPYSSAGLRCSSETEFVTRALGNEYRLPAARRHGGCTHGRLWIAHEMEKRGGQWEWARKP